MAISQSTYESRKVHLLRTLKYFSKSGSKAFTVSSAWLQRKYGIHYAKMLREIEHSHGLTVTQQEQLAWHDGGKTYKKGWCREYSFPGALPPVPVTDPLPNPETLTDAARDFLGVYEASNLAELGIPFQYTLGKHAEDGREYTSVAHYSKKRHAPLQLIGQDTVEIDVANAFPAFMISLCPVAEDYLRRVANDGRLYEMLMKATGVSDRDIVKEAVNTMLNHPGRLLFRSRLNDGWFLQRTEKQFLMYRVTKYVELAFPKFYKWVRKQARDKKSYYMSSQMEREIMHTVQKVLRSRIPSQAIVRKHDALLVAAQFEGLVRTTMKQVLGSLLKQPFNLHATLFVTPDRAQQIAQHLATNWVAPPQLFADSVVKRALKAISEREQWAKKLIVVFNSTRS